MFAIIIKSKKRKKGDKGILFFSQSLPVIDSDEDKNLIITSNGLEEDEIALFENLEDAKIAVTELQSNSKKYVFDIIEYNKGAKMKITERDGERYYERSVDK